MYILDIDEISDTAEDRYIPYNDLLVWKSDNKTNELCHKKGKPEVRNMYYSVLNYIFSFLK